MQLNSISYTSIIHKIKILSIKAALFDELIVSNTDKLVVLIDNNEIWLKENYSLPRLTDLKKNDSEFFNHISKSKKFCIILNNFILISYSATSIERLIKQNFRTSLDQLDKKLTQDLMLGAQLIKWADSHLFCSECGDVLQINTSEVAKTCTKCNKNYYPVISPVAIVLIYRKYNNSMQILLAKAKRSAKYYSCLAGFVEAGENVENCVHREVLEEVGVKIKNLQYFGSQSWPFPSQLMLAYLAEWSSGEINVDTNELFDAQWFALDKLPPRPPNISIAGQMISHFTSQQLR